MRAILKTLRLLNKLILSTQVERLNSTKLFNKYFNKEVVYNYREL